MVIAQNSGVMTPFSRGHGDSRYHPQKPSSKKKKNGWLFQPASNLATGERKGTLERDRARPVKPNPRGLWDLGAPLFAVGLKGNPPGKPQVVHSFFVLFIKKQMILYA